MSKKCCKKDKPCKGCPRRAKQAGIQCAVDDCQMAMIVVSVNVFNPSPGPATAIIGCCAAGGRIQGNRP